MKNQNKILLSLLSASVSALATMPAMANDVKDEIDSNKDNVINLPSLLNQSELTQEEKKIQDDIRIQIDALLNKRSSMSKINQNIELVVENFGENNQSIKNKIFEELKLAATINPNDLNEPKKGDSVTTPDTTRTDRLSGNQTACHAVCHYACHSACHVACHIFY